MTKCALLALAALAACAAPGDRAAAPRQYTPGDNPDLPFSRAVLTGDTLWVSGHLGLDPDTGRAPADPGREAELLLDAFAGTIERAGMTMDDLVQVQVFCSDVELYDVFNAAYRERFDGAFPARAFIGSGTLLRGARFEMLGVAVGR